MSHFVKVGLISLFALGLGLVEPISAKSHWNGNRDEMFLSANKITLHEEELEGGKKKARLNVNSDVNDNFYLKQPPRLYLSVGMNLSDEYGRYFLFLFDKQKNLQ